MHGIYRGDFMRAAGCGNRTAWCPGRLVVNPGGVTGPFGINLAWFALAALIRTWLVLGGPKGTNHAQAPKRGQMCGHVPFGEFAQIRRAIWQGPSLEVPLAAFRRIFGNSDFHPPFSSP